LTSFWGRIEDVIGLLATLNAVFSLIARVNLTTVCVFAFYHQLPPQLPLRCTPVNVRRMTFGRLSRATLMRECSRFHSIKSSLFTVCP
jgi:hypothetical protein